MQPLKLLIVEDKQDDAELLLRELRRANFDPLWSRVETEAEFLTELQRRPDIVLSDYSMPQFSGLRALDLLRESGMDIPFILISGTVGEDAAVEAMRDGAADYLLKDRTARLASAVNRALLETKVRAERNQTAEELREKVEMLKLASLERDSLISSLEAALSEKTVLLKEVHHRVKNNLALIGGLLGMQADSLDNERARLALEESQQRVLSMALIHDHLYAAEHLDRVNIGRYVHQLANELCATYTIDPGLVAIEVKTEQIELSVHRAIPCGLILNELISNALKYAFPEGRRGVIVIHFGHGRAGQLLLSCRDDGVGMPEGLNWQTSDSLGLKIVNILAKQLDGNLVVDRSGRGTYFELQFPIQGRNH